MNTHAATSSAAAGETRDRRVEREAERKPTGPFLHPDSHQVWARLRKQRDQCHDALARALTAEGITPQLLKSEDWRFPVLVSCEVWMPGPAPYTTRRFKVTISVQHRPHLEYDMDFRGSFEHNGRTTQGASYRDENPDWKTVAAGLVDVFQGRTKQPPLLFRRSFSRWFANLRKRDRYLPFKEGLPAAATVVAIIGLSIPYVNVLAAAVIGIGGIVLWLEKRGKTSANVFDTGRPSAMPRILGFVDTWHAILPGIGRNAEAIRQDLLANQDLAESFSRPALETIWHLGRDGAEARDQLVYSYGRAMVFVHVVASGADLYVGWDSHLNRGSWIEEGMGAGVGRDNYPVQLTRTVEGLWPLSNSDFADVNTISEAVHRNVVRMVRRLVAEHAIDKEIDFEIIRSRRADQALDERKGGGSDRRFRRTG